MSKKINMNSIKKNIFIGLSIFFPVIYIQAATATTLNTVANSILKVFGELVYVILGVAVLLFLWGIVVYMTHGNEEEKRTEAKNYMVWGVVCLAVMFSLWGLVYLVTGSFDLSGDMSTTTSLPSKE